MHTTSPNATDLLTIAELDDGVVAELVGRAAALKSAWRTGDRSTPLAGRAAALVFERQSLRTRVSFEVGLARLGMKTVPLTSTDVGLGSREAIEDIARSLARYVDLIVVRILSHETLEALASAADVPVVNALTDREHPCQALADMLTLQEHLGPLAGRSVAFVGDGANNVAASLMLAGAALGMQIRVGAPVDYQPDPSVVALSSQIASRTGGAVTVTDDPAAAVRDVDAVYTDTWASMGAEAELAQRRQLFGPYRVDERLLTAAKPDALAMHCLPAHRGDEIEDAILDGPRGVSFDQAENRLYVQQAVAVWLLEENDSR